MLVYEEAWALTEAGAATDAGLQSRLRCAAVLANEVGMDVCRAMFRYAGARSLFAGNVIERCLRDVQAGAQHGMVNDVAYEARGQTLLGVQDVAALT